MLLLLVSTKIVPYLPIFTGHSKNTISFIFCTIIKHCFRAWTPTKSYGTLRERSAYVSPASPPEAQQTNRYWWVIVHKSRHLDGWCTKFITVYVFPLMWQKTKKTRPKKWRPQLSVYETSRICLNKFKSTRFGTVPPVPKKTGCRKPKWTDIIDTMRILGNYFLFFFWKWKRTFSRLSLVVIKNDVILATLFLSLDTDVNGMNKYPINILPCLRLIYRKHDSSPQSSSGHRLLTIFPKNHTTGVFTAYLVLWLPRWNLILNMSKTVLCLHRVKTRKPNMFCSVMSFQVLSKRMAKHLTGP